MARIYLGNVKGPKGDTGATGATGPQGEAATIEVGSVSTTAYGNAAQVTNVGSSGAAKFNFVIPQGKPGEKTTKMGELTLDTITTSTEEFPSPVVGDTGATAFGKIVKWFADGLAALTSKLDANKVVDSQAVTEDGYALSAKQANPNISGSLAAQISTLNDSLTHNTATLSLASGVTLITSDIVKSNGICYLNGTFQRALTLNTWNDIGTLPSGYRPSVPVRSICLNASKDCFVNLEISALGLVRIYPISPSTATASNIGISASFVCS